MSASLKTIAGTEGGLHEGETHEVVGSVHNTVDIFDAAAHLESMGFGGQVSVRHGYSNTFEHADALVRTQVAGVAVAHRREHISRRRTWQHAWSHATARSVTMLCGVLICVATVAARDAGSVFAAGAIGWLSGQLVSATMWHGLSISGRLRAQVNGAVVGTVVLVIAGGCCLLIGSWVPLLWALWCCAISALVITGSMDQVLAAVLPSAALTGVLLALTPDLAVVVSRIIVIGFALATGAILFRATWGAREAFLASIRGLLHPVLVWSTLQTAALIVQLALLVTHVGETFTLALAVAGLSASAACEPVLDSALLGAKRFALLTGSWQQLRLITAGLGVLAVFAVSVVSLAAGAILLIAKDGTSTQAHVFLPAVVITALATVGSGIQLRTGNAEGAAFVAIGSLGLVLLLLPLGSATGLLFAALILFVVVSTVAARRTSLSANW